MNLERALDYYGAYADLLFERVQGLSRDNWRYHDGQWRLLDRIEATLENIERIEGVVELDEEARHAIDRELADLDDAPPERADETADEPDAISAATTTERQDEILAALRDGMFRSMRELRTGLHLSANQIRDPLSELVAHGRVIRIGEGSGTKYRRADDPPGRSLPDKRNGTVEGLVLHRLQVHGPAGAMQLAADLDANLGDVGEALKQLKREGEISPRRVGNGREWVALGEALVEGRAA